MENKKVNSFSDLNAWKQGHNLVLAVYKLTNNFPKTESFILADQIRRCALSVTNNIAQGFSRNSIKEKQQFYLRSMDSTAELQNLLLIARDLGHISSDEFKESTELTTAVRNLVKGLIKISLSHTQ